MEKQKIEPYYQMRAKEIIDGMFSAKVFHEKITRDDMNGFEDLIANELGLEMSLVRNEIAMRKEMMSDIAMAQLMDKGKVELVTDEFGNDYEPVFKVVFKKSKEKAKK
ncbi:MAG TPA: hypothetical protein DDY52_03395 [Candidatus Moranbacteria bacterium]|nr:hypothetical protein [Candidatus Moranbacteria bacterium]